jgi:2',3'-cyclic-nucleotide 2'-phosphodiesterase (5'-nucleotidase family)
MNYTVDRENKKLSEMNFIDKQGNVHKIDVNNPSETKKYKVVTDEFLMSAGADFNVMAIEENYLKKYPYDKDVMVCDYIKRKNEPIVINQFGRIKFTDK